jgi:hypothetical protein
MIADKLAHIAEFLNDKTYQNQEVEIRFGSFTPKGFESKISYATFDRMKQRLAKVIKYSEDVLSTVYIERGNRQIVEPDGKITTQTKQKIAIYDIPEYNIRLSLANEQPGILPLDFTPVTIRERIRTTYKYSPYINIDFTEVIQTDLHRQTITTTYEVEIEYIGSADNIIHLNDELPTIYKYYLGSENIYTQSELSHFIRDLDRIPPPRLERKQLVDARNLHRRDLVYGGIVGNKDTRYMVTYKADGFRKLLILHTTGLWLIYPPNEYNLVIKSSPDNANLFNTTSISVIDGELVKSETGYYYLAFDTLIFANRDVRNKPYYDQDRQKSTDMLVKVINARLGSDPILVEVKPSALLADVPSYFRLVREYVNTRKNLPYEEDGLIFFPADTSYMSSSVNLPLNKRILTDVPDICKWKPGEQITTDFVIEWKFDKTFDLMVYDPDAYDPEKRKKGMNVVFRGTHMNPLNPEIIDMKSVVLYPHNNPVPTGTVVEFAYYPNLNKLEPIKIRHDKRGANKRAIAEDNWDMMFKPITEEELTGESLAMAFTYHNRIKRELFEKIGSNKTLLDIGSGRGGDLSKWRNFSHIVAVEPDPINANEFEERLNRMTKLRDKVKLVRTGGENTALINDEVTKWIGDKVDVVSLMLSLSFFWSSREMLAALINTIVSNLKPNGQIIFLTIDGQSLDLLFQKNNTVKIGPAKFTKEVSTGQDYGQKVSVVLPGTIVETQEEYLVFLNNLTQGLQPYGYDLEYQLPATGELLLSESNMLFSSLYSYGQYSGGSAKVSPVVKPSPVVKTSPAVTPIQPRQAVTPIQPSPAVTPIQPRPAVTPIQPRPAVTPIQPRPAVTPIQPSLAVPPLPPVPTRPASRKGLSCERSIQNFLPLVKVKDGIEMYVPMPTSWYNNLVRIATIGDGNCFVHGLLLGFSQIYQEAKNTTARRKIVEELRRDMARKLFDFDIKYPKFLYWETAANGQYINLLIQQLLIPELVRGLNTDYSLVGLQYYLNSRSYLNEIFIDLFSRILQVNIFLLRADRNDINTHVRNENFDPNYPTVIIIGGGCHWELVGLKENDTIQTNFASDHPLIQTLLAKYAACETNDIPPFDPRENYLKIINELSEYYDNPIFMSNLSQLSDSEPLIQRLIRQNIITRNDQGQFIALS